MNWESIEGTGWIEVPGFGRINPRRDNEVAGGRQYFTAMTENDEHARATGPSIGGGPETWHFEFDQPFWLADRSGHCIEVEISLLVGGLYSVKYRPGTWPLGDSDSASGGWS